MRKKVGEVYRCPSSCLHLTRSPKYPVSEGMLREVQCSKPEGHTESEHVGSAAKDHVLWRDHQRGLVWDGAFGPHGRWLTMEQTKSYFTVRRAPVRKEKVVVTKQQSLLDWEGEE